MIDRLRHDIQQRLDQLHAEADKLRRALAALDPRARPRTKADKTKVAPTAQVAQAPGAAKPAPARTRTRGQGTAKPAGASTRTPPGQTKRTVLAALSSDRALTAGEVAQATGVARPTVSTTLSKLAKSGEVVKAQRGYRLPGANDATPAAAQPDAEPPTGA